MKKPIADPHLKKPTFTPDPRFDVQGLLAELKSFGKSLPSKPLAFPCAKEQFTMLRADIDNIFKRYLK